MKHVLAGVMLAVFMFIFLVLAIATHPALEQTHETIEELAEGEEWEGKISALHENANRAFWLLFFIAGGGLCLWYLLGSHEEEYEEEERYVRYHPRRYRR